jgi:hypothetical protein
VSTAAVSAVEGAGWVSPVTRVRVPRAADEMGSRRNQFARGLRTQRGYAERLPRGDDARVTGAERDLTAIEPGDGGAGECDEDLLALERVLDSRRAGGETEPPHTLFSRAPRLGAASPVTARSGSAGVSR